MMQFDNMRPIYLQLREGIEKAILRGDLKDDDPIPSIRQLSQEYNVNPQTVSNALGELIDIGVIFKRRGIGFFVAGNAGEILRSRQADVFRTNELIETFRKAKNLGIAHDEVTEILDRVYREKE